MGKRSIVIDGRIIFRPQCRGIGRAVIGLVEQFPEDCGEVKVLVPKGATSPFELGGVARRAELVETELSVTALPRVHQMTRLLRSLDAGVLYSPYHPFVPLHSPCPVVTTVHDCILEEDPTFAGGRLHQVAYRNLTRSALRRSTAVTVPSRATAHALSRYYPSSGAAEVIPNGVKIGSPGDVGYSTVDEAREALGLPARYLLHVGARRPHKNQARLVDALRYLDPSISLVLVGDADPRVDDPVGRLVKLHALEERVVTLQKVSDRHLPALYAGATTFVFPSLQEGFGIPPLEAMACGVPVVASAVPVMAEILDSAATLVSPFDAVGWADAIQRIAGDDNGFVEELVERGRDVASRATWERSGRRLHEMLSRYSA